MGPSENHTAGNWRIIRYVYEGWVTLASNELVNMRLPERHFRALQLAARVKPFRSPGRKDDDSLRKAIGNWLYSDTYGAWRNPNRAKPYKANNKELWQEFGTASRDCSLRKATGGG